MSAADWIERMRGVSASEVASARGMRAGKGGIECPACGAVTRHTRSKDKRAAIGWVESGFKCFQCDIGGDALNLLSYYEGGRRFKDLDEHDKDEVRLWACQWMGIDPGKPRAKGTAPAKPRPKRPPAPKRVERPAPPAKQYPDQAQVLAMWERAGRVDEDPQAAAWLRKERGIDPTAVADLDLVRVLPQVRREPYPWSFARGNRILVPMYDCRGVLRSLVFRRCIEGTAGAKKSLNARGRQTGLVMACSRARRMLKLGTHPSQWPSLMGAPWDDVRQPSRQQLQVVIAEGEMDFLCWATEWSDSCEFPPAVMGMNGSSWPREASGQVPAGSRVLIATDLDKAGEAYAKKLEASFATRDIEVARWEGVGAAA